MRLTALAILIGIIIAIPIIYFLELENAGGITFLILLCCGVVGVIISIIKSFKKEKDGGESDENQ